MRTRVPVKFRAILIEKSPFDWQDKKRLRQMHSPPNPNVTPPSPASDQLLDEIIASYLRAVAQGKNPVRDDLLTQYPQYADDLREFFFDHDRMNRLARPLCEPTQGPPIVPSVTRIRYFGDYEILEEIARGGMGVVFKARQVKLNRTVAIKMILEGRLAAAPNVQRFQKEAEAAAKLEHPGIVPIYEVGEYEGQHYFSMGFVDGMSLAARIASGPLPPREAVEIVRAVAGAVQYAHDQGVIHRDLKPGNILLDRQGKPRITDFGLAKLMESASDLTGTGQILGTPGYMPPEQAAAKVSSVGRLSDVYSLGAVLYCLLTGRPPFQAATAVETLLQVQQRDPVSPRHLNSHIPLDLETIALKCLEKDPRRRYSSAKEVAEELQRFLEGRPIVARPVGPISRTSRWCRRNPLVASLIMTVGISLLAGTVVSSYFAFEADKRAKSEAYERGQADIARRDAVGHAATSEKLRAQYEGERNHARDSELLARRRFYAAQINRAHQALEAGRTTQALELLEGLRPKGNDQDLRTFEWHYLRKLCLKTHRFTLEGHNSTVDGIAYSPDGTKLASVSRDRTVKIWDAASGQLLATLVGHRDMVFCVVFSPDGKTLVTAGNDADLRLWDVETWQPKAILKRRGGPVRSLAVSPDGKFLAVGSLNVQLWHLDSQQFCVELPTENQCIMSLSFSPDGKKLASSSAWGIEKVKLWDLANEPPRLIRESEGAWAVAFSPSGTTLAVTEHTGSFSGVRIIDTETGHQIAGYDSPEAQSTSVAFSPDGTILAMGCRDRSVRLWEIATGRNWTKPHLNIVTAVTFSPDGTKIASASQDRTVNTWDVEEEPDESPLQDFSGKAAIAYSPNGRILAYASNGVVRLSNPETGQTLARLTGNCDSLVFSQDSRSLAGSGKVVKHWDLTTFQELPTIDVSPHGAYCVSLSSDGKTLAAAVIGNGEVRLWNWETRESRSFKPSHGGGIGAVSLAPDGRKLVTTDQSGWIDFWNTETLTRTLRCDGTQEDWIFTMAHSPNGKILVTGGNYGFLWAWDTTSGDLLATFSGHSARITALAFFSDGQTLASSSLDGTVKLWDVTTGQERMTLVNQRQPILAVAVAPDGKTLATGAANGTLKFWRTTENKKQGTTTSVPTSADDDALPGNQADHLIAKAHLLLQRGAHRKADELFVQAAQLSKDELDRFLQAGWWVVGPYPNEMATSYSPEINPDPSRPVDGVAFGGKPAMPLKWHPVRLSDFDRFDVGQFLPTNIPCSAYVLNCVYSPGEWKGLLYFGSDGPRRVWVNGQLLHETNEIRYGRHSLDPIPIHLHAGRNTILLKLAGTKAPQYFFAKLDDSAVIVGLNLTFTPLYEEAAERLETSLLRMKSRFDWGIGYRLATAKAAIGDWAGFRQWRDRYWASVKDVNDPGGGFWVAHLYSLANESPSDQDNWLSKLKYALDGNDVFTFRQFIQAHLALAYLQCGKEVEGLHAAQDGEGASFPLCWIALALIHHRYDRPDQAQLWFQRVEDWYSENMIEGIAAETFTPKQMDWTSWTEFLILRRLAWKQVRGQEAPDEPWWLLLTGRERARRNYRDRADVDFQSAVHVRPDDPDVWVVRGRMFAELGWLDRAATDFQRASELVKQPQQHLLLARAAARTSVAATRAGDTARGDAFRQCAMDAIRQLLLLKPADKDSLKQDPDLKSVLDLPELEKLLK